MMVFRAETVVLKAASKEKSVVCGVIAPQIVTSLITFSFVVGVAVKVEPAGVIASGVALI